MDGFHCIKLYLEYMDLKKENPNFQSTNFNLFKTSFKKHTCIYY